MNQNDIWRRSFAKGIGLALATSVLSEPELAQGQRARRMGAESDADVAAPVKSRLQIGMLLYPGLSALDLIGPHPFLRNYRTAKSTFFGKTKIPSSRHWAMALFRPRRSETVLAILTSCLSLAVRLVHSR